MRREIYKVKELATVSPYPHKSNQQAQAAIVRLNIIGINTY